MESRHLKNNINYGKKTSLMGKSTNFLWPFFSIALLVKTRGTVPPFPKEVVLGLPSPSHRDGNHGNHGFSEAVLQNSASDGPYSKY